MKHITMLGAALMGCNSDEPEGAGGKQESATGLPEPAANEIYYTTTDGLLIDFSEQSWYNTSVISHISKDGYAVLTFATDIKAIINKQFYNDQGRYDSLESIRIPESVTEIGDRAFNMCESLTSIYCRPTTPPCIDNPKIFTWTTIYVPRESVAKYKGNRDWAVYANQIEGYDF